MNTGQAQKILKLLFYGGNAVYKTTVRYQNLHHIAKRTKERYQNQ